MTLRLNARRVFARRAIEGMVKTGEVNETSIKSSQCRSNKRKKKIGGKKGITGELEGVGGESWRAGKLESMRHDSVETLSARLPCGHNPGSRDFKNLRPRLAESRDVDHGLGVELRRRPNWPLLHLPFRISARLRWNLQCDSSIYAPDGPEINDCALVLCHQSCQPVTTGRAGLCGVWGTIRPSSCDAARRPFLTAGGARIRRDPNAAVLAMHSSPSEPKYLFFLRNQLMIPGLERPQSFAYN